jgi:general secretion pathway protein I
MSAARRHRFGPRRRAFTLMEVLIALMIVAMAVVVLGASYLNVLNSYEAVGRGMVVNEDFAFARQTVLTEPDRTKLERGGDFETTGGRRVKWTAEIESTTVPDVFRVVFACEIDDPSRTEADKQTQTFHLLRPTWVKDAAERGKLVEQMKTRIAEIQGDIASKQARR